MAGILSSAPKPGMILKALGLNLQPNPLDYMSCPPGSLLLAQDIIIKRDNIVEPRRGYNFYGQTFGTSTDIAKQLINYRGILLRHYGDKLSWDTGTLDSSGLNIFTDFSGSFTEPQTGLRIKSIEANGNLYFTTDKGIKKISAIQLSDLSSSSGFVTSAGGIKAIDLNGWLSYKLGDQSNFLTQDSVVAYRTVWGTNDLNKNEILGTPSQRFIIYNPLINFLLEDFDRLLVALDNVSNNGSSLISNADYYANYKVTSTTSALTLQTNLINLATELDNDILYADTVSAPLQISGAYISNGTCTISFSSGTPSNYLIAGNKIKLAGFTPTSGNLNYTITNSTATNPQTVSSTNASYSTTGDTTLGVKESTPFTVTGDTSNSLAGTYFTVNSANDATSYYVWYNVSGNGLDPAISGKKGLRVDIITNETQANVASKTAAAIIAQTSDFTTSSNATSVTTTCSANGPATDATAGTSGFSVGTITQGIVGNVITNVANTTGVKVGQHITGNGIASGTYVTNFTVNTVTLSQDVTATNTGVTLNFDATLNFTTTASGTVTTSTPTINSAEYESIAQPSVPSLPPTNAQLVALQTYIQAIITQLQSELSTVISTNSQNTFISPLAITNSANVQLKITIPNGVTTNDFLQIYRSQTFPATDAQVLTTDIFPNDELQLVYEAYPTSNDITNGYIQVKDITSIEFAGAYLYTNATTGEGISQANDVPPLALDINYYKNYTFYANTQTRYTQSINLLGVVNLISDYNNGTTPKLVVTDGTTTHTYSFVTGLQQKTTFTTVADSAGSLAGKYFTFSNANNEIDYYGYYIVSGTGVDPALSGKIAVPIYISTNETANNVALKTTHAIGAINQDFTCTNSTNTFQIVNVNFGSSTTPAVGTSGFSVNVNQAGRGEDASAKQVLLSTNSSPAEAVDETSRSLVRIINQQSDEIINAFYLSDVQSVPGQMQFEARGLGQSAFYLMVNDSNVGSSFSPNISPATFTIINISVANPTVITTSSPHGFTNQQKVVICASNSTPSIDGLYTITVTSPTQFTIPVNVTGSGNFGAIQLAANVLTATNSNKPNRLYYSKKLQPEAVPATNYLDIGAQDKAILRIFPLRDSLFVFKEDGLWRVSGLVAPFSTDLFDLSVVLIAPDTVDAPNDKIYAWTTQGITTVTESGSSILSRPIDVNILPLATSQYTNFKTATWGKGYESDNSYKVWTVKATSDSVATIAYRYSSLTNTWTTFNFSATCGVTNSADDVEYLGAGDTNSILKERKNFDRTDYADRQYTQTLASNQFFNSAIQVPDITEVSVGDVITQVQYVTEYNYNNLLQKLDTDLTLTHTYYSTLQMKVGDNPRTKVDALIGQVASDATRLAQGGATAASVYNAFKSINGSFTITGISAANPTVITCANHGLQTGRNITITGSDSIPSVDGTYYVTVVDANTFTIPMSVTTSGTTGSYSINNSDFKDVESSFNSLITTLNNDAGVTQSNYLQITTSTLFEAVVTATNTLTKMVTLNLNLQWLQGPITIYKAINSLIQYTPHDLQNPLTVKQFSEIAAFFENKAFTSAQFNISSDLLPAFKPVPMNGDGNGIFGNTNFGFGFFGGSSNAAPFRTLIPRQCQRCRYLNIQFEHQVAREKFSLLGIAITGRDTGSTKAYR